ncbi:MAG: ribosome biogenesis factor YjgA [Woeseiaceae bacterium]|nr:ribosome biogenesis factor YjgA [Woeseiaceae bacterium]
MTDPKPSKSARKRQQIQLQKLGEELIDLSDSDLESFGLDQRIVDAVRAARSIRSHGALRRQKQLIGKLMRDLDPEPIRAGLAALRADDLAAKRVFANAEQWRDRLLREGAAAVAAFEQETGQPESGLARLLADNEVAISDRAEKTLRREIFRRVHEILVKIAR